MEYHEIGERFEYDGVVLEVVEGTGLWTEDCVNCEVKNPRIVTSFIIVQGNIEQIKRMYITNSLNNVTKRK